MNFVLFTKQETSKLCEMSEMQTDYGAGYSPVFGAPVVSFAADFSVSSYNNKLEVDLIVFV